MCIYIKYYMYVYIYKIFMSKQIFTHNKIESLRSKGNGSKCSSKVLNNFLLKFLYINKNSAINQ